MRADPRTRIRIAARTHAHIHIYTHVRTRTHVYAHAKEIFWQRICFTALPNRLPSSVRHHSLLLPNRCTIRIHIGTTLAAVSVQTAAIWHNLTTIIIHSEPLSNYHRLLINHSIIYPTNSHTLSLPSIISNTPSTHHILSLSDFKSNSPSYQYVSML